MKIVLLSVFATLCSSAVVSTHYGLLKGKEKVSSNGTPVEIYKGIPFAKPIVDALRYTKPEEPDNWNGILDAREYKHACLSNSSQTFSPQKDISEDCLYLNIYTSTKCRKEGGCAVLFYIHGGAMLFESATMFPDEHLMDHFAAKDIVLVIPGYRLGSFGLFASPFEDVTPHNLAAHDLVRALEFVRDEVEAFGGDARRLTALGHSAGGELSLALSFSRRLNQGGLIAQAAAMSPGMQLVALEDLHALSFQFARKAGCTRPDENGFADRETTEEIVNCLRKIDGHDLLLIQRRLEDEDKLNYTGFALTYPFTESGRLDEFLRTAPNVPLLLGSTSKEFDGIFKPPGKTHAGNVVQVANGKEVEEKYFADLLSRKYAPHHSYDSQTIYVCTFLYGSAMVTQNKAPVYLYQYDMPDAIHTTDHFYVMGVHEYNLNEDEQIMNTFYSDYFANFTKYSEPSQEWKKLDPAKKNYFRITINSTTGDIPRNCEGYEEVVVDYWLKNITQFDKQISVKKRESARKRSIVPLNSLEPSVSVTSPTTFLILLGILIIGGIVISAVLASAPKKRSPVPKETSPLLADII